MALCWDFYSCRTLAGCSPWHRSGLAGLGCHKQVPSRTQLWGSASPSTVPVLLLLLPTPRDGGAGPARLCTWLRDCQPGLALFRQHPAPGQEVEAFSPLFQGRMSDSISRFPLEPDMSSGARQRWAPHSWGELRSICPTLRVLTASPPLLLGPTIPTSPSDQHCAGMASQALGQTPVLS